MKRKYSVAAMSGQALLFSARVAAVALLAAEPAGASDSGPPHADGLSAGQSIIGRALHDAGTRGLQMVDPLSLNPPALIEYEPWFSSIPYDLCWKGASEITCVAYLRTFQVGDGSLEGAGGQPLDWGIVCDQGYSLYQQFRNTWAIVRFYTLNGDIVSRYRLEIGEGTVYNSGSGKAAKLWFDDLFASTWSPPGALETETITIYGNDWSAATPRGKPLALSHGAATFFPDGTWQQKGAHPLDAYFFGDASGIAPVCSYVK